MTCLLPTRNYFAMSSMMFHWLETDNSISCYHHSIVQVNCKEHFHFLLEMYLIHYICMHYVDVLWSTEWWPILKEHLRLILSPSSTSLQPGVGKDKSTHGGNLQSHSITPCHYSCLGSSLTCLLSCIRRLPMLQARQKIKATEKRQQTSHYRKPHAKPCGW